MTAIHDIPRSTSEPPESQGQEVTNAFLEAESAPTPQLQKIKGGSWHTWVDDQLLGVLLYGGQFSL